MNRFIRILQKRKYVRDTLFPEIRHELMNIQPLTVENLMAQGKAALTSLKMMESVRGFRTSRLPPISEVQHFRGCTCFACDPNPESSTTSEDGDEGSPSPHG